MRICRRFFSSLLLFFLETTLWIQIWIDLEMHELLHVSHLMANNVTVFAFKIVLHFNARLLCIRQWSVFRTVFKRMDVLPAIIFRLRTLTKWEANYASSWTFWGETIMVEVVVRERLFSVFEYLQIRRHDKMLVVVAKFLLP